MFSNLPICRTCAVQRDAPTPAICPICADDRQYVGYDGQQWTDLEELSAAGHRCAIRELEPGLLGIGVEPSLAIGQRSLVVTTPQGSVLWDPTGFLDAAAVAAVRELGPLRGIAASHPHFYEIMGEWSRLLDAPLLLPRADEAWLPRNDVAVDWWDDELAVLPGVRLVRCGGHFDGSAVLHWEDGAEGRGALLVGDTATVVPDRQHVSIMRSYPNLIPLPARDVQRIGDQLLTLPFDRIYGAWWPRVVDHDGHDAVRRSVTRYVRWVSANGGS